METLITIAALLLLSAISSWIQKRNQPASDGLPDLGEPSRPLSKPSAPKPTPSSPTLSGSTPPPLSTPHPKPRMWDWAEELRRVLEQESTESPRPTPQPMTIPPTAPQPPVVPGHRPAIPSQPRPSPVVIPSGKPLHSVESQPAMPAGGLMASIKAYETASQLSTEVTQHLHDVASLHAAAPATVRRAHASREIVEATRLLRRQSGIRQAWVAATILGSPKGLEGFPVERKF